MVKQSMNKLFVGATILSTSASLFGFAAGSDNGLLTTSQSFFQPRAASANMAREMLMQPGSKLKSKDGWYGEFSATGFFQRSWNQNSLTPSNSTNSDNDGATSSLGAMPFWSGSNVMTVGNNLIASTSSSAVPNLDAYQFGMGDVTPGAIASTVSLNPSVYQTGADFMFIVGSSEDRSGFLFKIKAPLAVYNINPQLTVANNVTAQLYEPGQVGTNGTTEIIANNMIQAFAGKGITDQKTNKNNGQVAGQSNFVPMNFGLINGQISSGVRFADVEVTAGYMFVSEEKNSFSFAVRASLPSGNTATGEYLLEPIVGRGGCAGLGGYAAGHVKAWQGNNDNSIAFKYMSNIMHLFAASTMRTYDLIENGQGSRYLLVGNFSGGTFQSSVQNLVNFTTLQSSSSFGVEGDIAVAFNYSDRGWGFDLGYEFWGRSAETLVITGEIKNQTYGILGRQEVISVTPSSGGAAGIYVQPNAQFNVVNGIQPATDGIALPAGVQLISATGSLIGTSSGANANSALNVPAAAQKASLTSKIFAKVAYEWTESDYVPFLGVIGEFEISNSNNNALPQWGLVLVGGLSF